eukprot:TRINITY_DN89932_c0_g1_i1.p2 TRINITY_DN89932_c0_g1~~TRINITY_DN89932_c0_g1_i1.p2  ORF type:complete len:141 (-),score=29.32 TRINITY_DN89932_c0_g1_i1:17-439(-)
MRLVSRHVERRWLLVGAWMSLIADYDGVLSQLVCGYTKLKGRAYTGARVWEKFGSEEEAKRFCDNDEDCAGYHLHPVTSMWYVHPRAAELVKDPATSAFAAFKKRDMTCHDPQDSEEEEEEEEEEQEEGQGAGGTQAEEL